MAIKKVKNLKNDNVVNFNFFPKFCTLTPKLYKKKKKNMFENVKNSY